MAGANTDENEEQTQNPHALPAKRRPNLASVAENRSENENVDAKKPKLCFTFSSDSVDNSNPSSVSEEKEIDEDDGDEEDYEGEDEYEEEDEDDDEDEDHEEDSNEHSNEKTEVDRKGKGMLTEDKGKGKLIVESEDSSDGGNESDGESSDLSDDPLAEVDLDNILPSRTRRGVVRPGVRISNDDLRNNDED